MGYRGVRRAARRELQATGETAHKRSDQATVGATWNLTAHEAQVARLAREGLSNPQIGARLFISTRTVQYHLGKVFTKLGITSRGQLDQALPRRPGRRPVPLATPADPCLSPTSRMLRTVACLGAHWRVGLCSGGYERGPAEPTIAGRPTPHLNET